MLHPYKKTAMDYILKGLGSRIGVDFSNHDLKRTMESNVLSRGIGTKNKELIFRALAYDVGGSRIFYSLLEGFYIAPYTQSL